MISAVEERWLKGKRDDLKEHYGMSDDVDRFFKWYGSSYHHETVPFEGFKKRIFGGAEDPFPSSIEDRRASDT